MILVHPLNNLTTLKRVRFQQRHKPGLCLCLYIVLGKKNIRSKIVLVVLLLMTRYFQNILVKKCIQSLLKLCICPFKCSPGLQKLNNCLKFVVQCATIYKTIVFLTRLSSVNTDRLEVKQVLILLCSKGFMVWMGRDDEYGVHTDGVDFGISRSLFLA